MGCGLLRHACRIRPSGAGRRACSSCRAIPDTRDTGSRNRARACSGAVLATPPHGLPARWPARSS
ncbi:hypothetical protein SGM_6737 [Streptomyces griseoaurantiacus M045]|uniref:Uncharacterized protein n=1 Tax=Streptomyces griseoaurantiacus M045 TaxID=996637 RepID=F3NC48_9ACTN|nr:hypothetical protein SGM_6737 [Streptomyces griseoaurantiacus M045]